MICDGHETIRIPYDPRADFAYVYDVSGSAFDGCGATVFDTYKIEFTTENESHLGPPGTYYLSPEGISAVPPF